MAGRMRLGHLGNMPHARMRVIERDREQAAGIYMYAYTCAFWGCSGLRRFRGDFGPGAHSVENLIVEYVKRKGVGRIGRGGRIEATKG